MCTLLGCCFQVRKKAQSCLISAFTNFPYTYRTVLKEVVDNVLQPDCPEHKFKVGNAANVEQ